MANQGLNLIAYDFETSPTTNLSHLRVLMMLDQERTRRLCNHELGEGVKGVRNGASE